MAENVPVLTAIKEMLDDDASLRRRFRACARTRRSVSPEEVDHWRGVLRGETSSQEVAAALGSLTLSLMPNSLSAEDLSDVARADGVPTDVMPTGTLAGKEPGGVASVGEPATGAPAVGRAAVGDGEPVLVPPSAGRLRLVDPDGTSVGRGRCPEDTEDHDCAEDFEEGEPGAAAEGITVAEEIARARRALSDLVLSDEGARAAYEKQCEQGLIGMFGRGRALRLALEARGEVHEQGAVEVAIPELASKRTRAPQRRRGSGCLGVP